MTDSSIQRLIDFYHLEDKVTFKIMAEPSTFTKGKAIPRKKFIMLTVNDEKPFKCNPDTTLQEFKQLLRNLQDED